MINRERPENMEDCNLKPRKESTHVTCGIMKNSSQTYKKEERQKKLYWAVSE